MEKTVQSDDLLSRIRDELKLILEEKYVNTSDFFTL